MSGRPVFTVVYDPAALADLASAWTNAADRNAVTAAVERTDRALRADPHAVGVEVSEGLRGLNEGPLRFNYSIEEDDRVVRVAAVRLLMPPKSGNGRPPTRKV